MGVKLLSSLLKSYCSDVVEKHHMGDLFGKKICIDSMIYLYRFKSQDALIEKFYLMCTLFKYYNITPLFVFDGKPPEEKREEISKRKTERKKAKEQYYKLKEMYGNKPTKEENESLRQIKRKMTYITYENITDIQNLIEFYGMKYMVAHGEADRLCASLVLKKKVYAVLTEDMDLFALGCPNVLRYISLTNHTYLSYDLNKILKKLEITLKDFQYLCVLSGNDYYKTNKNIFNYLKLYKRYRKNQKVNPSFNDWLLNNKTITDNQSHDISNAMLMYNDINKELNNYKYFTLRLGSVDKENLFSILHKDRFIFV